MAGMFDDLVPQQNSGGMFDDLVPQTAPRARKSGAVGDAALNAGASVNRALEGVTNLFGADSAGSQFFRGNAETLDGQLSQNSADEAARNAAELDATEGFWSKMAVSAKQAAKSPLQSAAKAVGFVAPSIATAGAGAAIGLGARGLTLLNALSGTVQGAGAVKGGIYETVMQAKDADLMQDPDYAAMRATMPEAKAKEEFAVLQQSYAENPGKITAGAAIGAATGVTGLEGSLARGMVRDRVQSDLKRSASLGTIPKVMTKEGLTEFPQEMTETALGNTGAASGGANINPLQGVPEAGGQALVMGPMAGGMGGALEVSSARRQLKGMAAQDAIDARNVVDAEQAPAAPLALPAPRIIVNERGQAVREGSGRVFDEAPATVVGRVEPEMIREELKALGFDPVQRATPTPITVDSEGNALKDGQSMPIKDEPAARVSGRVDPLRDAVREELLRLGFDPVQRATPTPITVDSDGNAVADSQITPRDVTVEPAAKAVGRAPVEVQAKMENEVKALGLDPVQRATPTPISVDSQGNAALQGDTRSAYTADEQALDAQARKLYPKDEAMREEWKVQERSRAQGFEARVRALAEASNARKKKRGVPIQTTREAPMRDVDQTSELGVVRRTEPDGSTRYFFYNQPEASLVLKAGQNGAPRAISSISSEGQAQLLRAALADGPLAAGPKTIARGVLGELDAATDRFGVTRLVGRNATKATLAAEANRMAATAAKTQADKRLGRSPDLSVAQAAIAADPRSAYTALRMKDEAQMLQRLREIAGQPDPNADTVTAMPEIDSDPRAVYREQGIQDDPEMVRYVTDAARDAVNDGHLSREDFFAATRAAREGRPDEAMKVLGKADASRAQARESELKSTNEQGSNTNGPAVKRSGSSRGRSDLRGERPDGAVGRPGNGSGGWVGAAVRKADAAIETGVHYGRRALAKLSGSFFGSGLKGAERERLEQTTDERIKKRIYFYVPNSRGEMPARESGLGGEAHRLTMGNLFDWKTSAELQYDGTNNGFESAVLDAGYDGYVIRDTGVAVLLNQENVPVDYIGPVFEVKNPMTSAAREVPEAAQAPVKIALMSREIAQLEPRMSQLQEVAPSANMRSGNLVVNAADEKAARGFLAALKDGPSVMRSSGARDGNNGATNEQVESQRAGDGAGRDTGRSGTQGARAPDGESRPALPGYAHGNIKGAAGPDGRIVAAAEQYARDNGIDLDRQEQYAEVDEERGSRIAAAYEAMPHAPQDPQVKEAYQNLIDQTVAQYRALVAAGYSFWFMDPSSDPYQGNPWNAMRDLRATQQMAVFPTDAGFGSNEGFDPALNPLLADTGIEWHYGSPDGPLRPVYANDLFRAVHDAFGHGVEGSGFRAQGEENAWQAHARLFTGTALGALTSETRGQNSWLNFNRQPFREVVGDEKARQLHPESWETITVGQHNQDAKLGETIFADQKTGLMPEWTWTEGRDGGADEGPAVMRGRSTTKMRVADELGMFDKLAPARSALTMNWVIENPFDARRVLKLPSFREAASITKRQLGEAIDAFRTAKVGVRDYSAKAVDRLATALTDEVQWYAKNAKDPGLDWYTTKFQRAIDVLSATVPSLKERDHRGLFTALLAITSDGTDVQSNLNFTMTMYQGYLDGKNLVDLVPQAGQQTASYRKNAAVVHEIIGDRGLAGAVEFLLEPMLAADVKAEMKLFGEKSPASDYPDDAKLPRAAVWFGPKLGAFYANLMGERGYLTMDRWWNRTINRYRGNMAASATEQSIDTFRELVSNEDLSDEEVILQAQVIAADRQRKYQAGQDSGTPYRASKLETLATTIDKNARTELRDSPSGPKDRAFQISVVRRAQDLLAERGLEASVADIQATIWYYEKDLFEKIGVKGKGRVSYEEAARNWSDRHSSADVSGAGADAGRPKNADAAQRAPQVQNSLFDDFEPAGSRPAVSRLSRGSLSGELAALAGTPAQSSAIESLGKALSSDARRTVEVTQLVPNKDSAPDRLARQVKSRLGLDVVFFTSNDTAAPKGGAAIASVPDAVFVNAAEANQGSFIVGHEILHQLRAAYPDLYDALVKTLRARVQTTQANAGRIREDYAQGGFTLVSDSLVEEENLADVAGQAFADPGFWAALDAAKPGALKTMFRWIARWFAKHFGGKLDLSTDSGLDQAALDMRDDIAAAYAEMAKRNGDIRSLAADLELGVKRSGRARPVVDTPAFKRWFGDSKVVDAEGKPLVVYHGTLGDFDAFDGSKTGKTDNGYYGEGFYFTANTKTANFYAGGNAVMPVYLAISKPYVWPADRAKATDSYETSKITRELKAAGYDGIIVRNPEVRGKNAQDFYEVIAFRPEQIKSATGNGGNFDPASPDVRRSSGTPASQRSAPAQQDKPSVAKAAVLGTVQAASAVASPVTKTIQAANSMVDSIGKAIASVTGIERLGGATMDLIKKAVDARSSWGWVEHVKQGLISDYGIPEEYLSKKVDRQARENKQLRAAKTILDHTSDMSPDQLAMAYQWLQEKPNTARERELLGKLSPEQRATMQAMKDSVDKLSKEAMGLGLINQETYDRNAMAYIHRSYKKYEAELGTNQALVRSRAQRLKGDQFKGRGMELEASMDRVNGDLPENLKGMKLDMLEKRDDAGKLVRREFVVAGQARPASLKDYTPAGTWEVRDATKGGALKVWRDFTLAERQRMGEIEDARYGFARTMLQGVKDVETARFLDWVGTTYAKKDKGDLEVVELQPLKQALGTQTFTQDQWVKVPDTKIKDTQVNRYGALAGKFVPGVMWNDLIAMGDFQNTTWDKLLSMWKISKTALSPAVHVNNVMSNFIMADLADVGVEDIRKALDLIVKAKSGDKAATAIIERYQDSGAEAGSFAANEMKTEVLEPLLQQIVNDEPEAVRKATLMHVISLAAHGQIGEAAVAATKTLPGRAVGGTMEAMIQAYQSEDSVFRMAKFLNEVAAGKSDIEAGRAAKEAFLDYNINAPWVRAARRSVLPFISFTYRAVPLLAKNAITKPYKFAKYMALGYGLSTLAYAMLGGSADEEKEKRLLPEDRQGMSLIGLPKLIRMPWNDKDGDPVWLDVRRWLPGADVAEVSNSKSTIPLPSWLSVGGPLSLMIDFYSNTNFQGNKIVQATDSAGEMIEKTADMLMKFMLPNLPVPGLGSALRVVGVPVDQGNLDPYAWASLEKAAKGAKSATGKTEGLPMTLANTMGVKLDSRRISEELLAVERKYKAQEREIKTDLTRIANQGARGEISQAESKRRMQAEIDKLMKLGKEAGKKTTPAN